MASSRFTCGYQDCPFSTDSLEALAAHDAATGHPDPTGGPLAVAVARSQLLCGSTGGHEPSPDDPRTCGVCGAPIPGAVRGRFVCSEAGCDFSTADAAELDVHEVTRHGLKEVRPVPPRQLQGLLRESICAPLGAHIPHPKNPTVCLACGAPLEVLRG